MSKCSCVFLLFVCKPACKDNKLAHCSPSAQARNVVQDNIVQGSQEKASLKLATSSCTLLRDCCLGFQCLIHAIDYSADNLDALYTHSHLHIYIYVYSRGTLYTHVLGDCRPEQVQSINLESVA